MGVCPANEAKYMVHEAKRPLLGILPYTVHSRYLAVTFLQITHERHP